MTGQLVVWVLIAAALVSGWRWGQGTAIRKRFKS